ncbi:ABC transporter ATP-binding protein [Spiroplasma helicoides]|uniref:ABC transporter ATP-binding protein n=1 Tax=Spiroplasma helicoides TaxID=216938 RepID=A0A1B3SKG8_9MOLU|nr:ABC transporter ATP-binding protein [Spiroplasma helicoides]AOG60430.1 ABC transporter ATP-binding protein [Spiroplasma helicoides]
MFRIEGVTKKFDNNKGIFDINITFNEGDIVGLVGDNGAGKSTLLKCMFNNYKKDSGQFLYNDEEVNKAIMKRFSFFPDQSIYPKSISIFDFCVYSGKLSGIKAKEAKQKATSLLTSLDLISYKKKTFKSLSAGMQKRALLAICLINNPDIIVLDEPTANLDVSSRIEFVALLQKLARMGKTILITSHIIDELQKFINKLVIINEGEVVFDRYLTPEDNIARIYFNLTSNTRTSKIKIDELIK